MAIAINIFKIDWQSPSVVHFKLLTIIKESRSLYSYLTFLHKFYAGSYATTQFIFDLN